jgi:Glycine zipper
MERAEKRVTYRPTVVDAICVAVLIAYFLYFALPALRGGFRGDEMMNIIVYWNAGVLKSLLANLTFWTPFYRPGGALYYLPLYYAFGLDPEPYRIVQIGILALAIPMAFYLSQCLTPSRFVAFLAVLVFCYHPRVANLVFVGAFIYDVLCGFFYIAALTYYVHIRQKGLLLRPIQLLAFLALYICALNSKEMAVTLPVIVLIYEFLKAPRWIDWKAFVQWTWSYALPSLIAGLFTAIYIFGKTRGNGTLIRLDPYRPKISWHHFTTSNAKFVSDLLFLNHAITPSILLTLWAVVFIYAFMRRDRMLQLMAFWVVIVPLPIAFLVPIRGGACLYLLLYGWAMIFGKLASDLILLICKPPVFIGRSAGAGAVAGAIIGGVLTNRVRGTALGAGIGAAVGTMSPSMFRTVATVSVAFAVAAFTQLENQRSGYVAAWLGSSQKVSHVIKAVQSLNLRPAPRSTVLLRTKEDLFPNKWHVLFIASLVWNDHSLRIWLEGANPLFPRQQSGFDYIIALGEFDAQVVHAPDVPKSD